MTDMEGVSGIVVWAQVNGGEAMYEEGRRLYTQEINAAVQGALEGGATEVVVVDCHGAGGPWMFNSLIPEMLHPECTWVSHHPWSRYTELLEQGCDACLLVGMHARANTFDGVLSHTVSTTSWKTLHFNDQEVGEVGINAALCGHYGCSVLLVTGDEATARESKALLGDGLVTVAVKQGLTRYSARHIPPVRARQMIKEGARQALSNLKSVPPYVPARPTTITIELGSIDHAQRFMGLSRNVTIEGLKVTSTGPDWMTAWDQVWGWMI